MRTDNASLAREYLRWCAVEKGMSPLTVDTYGKTIRAFVEYIGAKPLAKVDGNTVQSFLVRERNAEGVGRRMRGATAAPATKTRELTTIRSFYKFLRGVGVLKTDPLMLVVAPKIHNINPKPVPDDVWVSVWRSKLPLDGRVALGLGYYCGLRRAEIVTIGPHHVSPLVGSLLGFKRKGGGDDIMDYAECVHTVGDILPHLLPDPKGWLDDVALLVEKRRGKACLIPWGDASPATADARRINSLPEHAASPQLVLKKGWAWQKAAGIPEGERFSPHQMRHSFVTNLLRCGVPIHIVSRLANHSSITTTMRYTKAGGSELSAWRKARGNGGVEDVGS